MINEIKLPKRTKQTKCKDCGKILTKTNRYPSCIKRGQFYCKKCWNKRFYIAVRKYRYGLSKEEIIEILNKQKKKCPICHNKLTINFCVDHNHKTHKIRGLLCRNCNSGLGMFKDSTNLLKNAINYMRKYHKIKLKESAENSTKVK